jgi:hypothetical protein
MPAPVSPPDPARTAAVARAIALLGPRSAAQMLDIGERTVYAIAAGDRRCNDGLLADIRKALITRRQEIAEAIQAIRDIEQAPAPPPPPRIGARPPRNRIEGDGA